MSGHPTGMRALEEPENWVVAIAQRRDRESFISLFTTFAPKVKSYLIRHGDEYMMWDTGQPMSAGAAAPKTPLPEQLAKLNIKLDWPLKTCMMVPSSPLDG